VPTWVRFLELAGAAVAVAALGLWLERKLPDFGRVVFAAGLALVDTGMLAGFVLLLLYLQSKTERINQALSALAGSGSLMGLFALPLVLLVDPGQPAAQVPALLAGVWLLLLIWNLFVMAHIIRHALSSSFAVGLGAAVLYALVSMQIVATLFPLQAV
jgi:hypothetical protein